MKTREPKTYRSKTFSLRENNFGGLGFNDLKSLIIILIISLLMCSLSALGTEADNIASLRTMQPVNGERIYLKCHTIEGKGGGWFRGVTGGTYKALDNAYGGFYMCDKPEYNTGILNIQLSEIPKAEHKKKFWDDLRAKVAADKAKPNIYRLMFTVPKDWKQCLPPFEIAKKQIDAWFCSDDSVKTSPELIFAVVPGEENIAWLGQPEIMNQIYDYITTEFKIPVYQWLSETIPPVLGIRADGWIFDAYNMSMTLFYSYAESYILYGKPVVPVLWASGHFSGYHKDKNFAQLTEFSRTRMDYCRALNLPVILFAVVQKPSGSAWAWFGKAETPEELAYRDFFRKYLVDMKTAPVPKITPPEKATVTLLIHRDGIGSNSNDFKSYHFTRFTTLDSPYNWRMTDSGPKLIGTKGTMSWNFVGPAKIDEAKIKFEYKLKNGRGRIVTDDGANTEFGPAENEVEIVLRDFENAQLMLEVEGDFVLNTMTVQHKGKFIYRTRTLKADKDGVLRNTAGFEDGTFEQSVTEATSVHVKPAVEFTKEGILQRGCVDGPASSTVTQKIELPGDAGTFRLKATAYAYWLFNTSVRGFISLDGKTPLAEVMVTDSLSPHSLPKKKKYQDVEMSTQIPQGTKAIYVTWILNIEKRGGTTFAPAIVRNCDLEFVK